MGTSTHDNGRRVIEPVDTIWLNMDRPNNLMVIESLMTFDDPMDWDRFVDVLDRRVLSRFPVFRQRPVWSGLPFTPPHWQDDDLFTFARHLHHVTLPDPGDTTALQGLVDDHVSRPLHRDRPLWEMFLVDGYDGGSAVYSRLHHSLADGIALTRVLLSLCDAAPGDDATEEEPEEPTAQEHAGVLGAGFHLAQTVGGAVLEIPHVLTPRHALDAFGLARDTTAVAAKLLTAHQPTGPLTGVPGIRKRVTWGSPIPLAEVLDIGHATGTTVNDVLVAALAGALATYLTEHGAEPADVPTMVPVNVRPADVPLPPELGNQFALVLLSLPSGLATPFARLAETKRRMDAIKHSPEIWLTFGMIQGIGRTGPEIERFLVNFFADKATGVTTNVPGPREPCYVAGNRVRTMIGWAPGSGKQMLETSIFTYDGRVHVGFKVDADTIEHPEQLMTAFVAELEALGRLAPALTGAEA